MNTQLQPLVEDLRPFVDNASNIFTQKLRVDYEIPREQRIKLRSIFPSAPITQNIDEAEKKESIQKVIFRYPYKFISFEDVEVLCKKYNFFVGDTQAFIGEIPNKNAIDIANANIDSEDVHPFALFGRIIDEKQRKIVLVRSIIYPKGFTRCDSDFFGQFGSTTNKELREKIEKIDEVSSCFHIAAPRSQFHNKVVQTGHFINSLTEFQSSTNLCEPIVLAPVKCGGFLIITAWGPESFDEKIVNPKTN